MNSIYPWTGSSLYHLELVSCCAPFDVAIYLILGTHGSRQYVNLANEILPLLETSGFTFLSFQWKGTQVSKERLLIIGVGDKILRVKSTRNALRNSLWLSYPALNKHWTVLIISTMWDPLGDMQFKVISSKMMILIPKDPMIVDCMGNEIRNCIFKPSGSDIKPCHRSS